ncbi:unnamed protein product [Nippostrongylus brasiliensis]|uniref:Sushi domain-containing protein n=1 Tax=Nippostrongylus brasiliensis TaxID=27835 RepID=A0A0N4XXI0_NIPBR|nr:unnamed protein product [Nippostrongylus brasiliensis]
MLLLLPTLVLIASISAEDPVKQDCPKLKEVENGKITVVDGVAKLKCVGKNFKAKETSCKVRRPTGMKVTYSQNPKNGRVEAKTVATVLCKKTKEVTELKCIGGKWTPAWKTIKCAKLEADKGDKETCKMRKAPKGGQVLFSTRPYPGNRVAVNTTATITCKKTKEIHTLLCKNGKWKPSWKTVTCVGTPEKKPKKVTCKARRAPVGGRVDFSTRRMPGNRVAVNTIATITCKDTNETHTLHCKDGKWKPRWKKVTCKPKKEKPEGPVDEPMPLPA